MANFHTHLVGAATVGIAANMIVYATGALPHDFFPAGVALTTLGGIMPDVDSDHSDSIRIIFNIFAIILSTILALYIMPQYGILIGMGILVAVFLTARFGFLIPFRKFTVHRGIFHSIPIALLFAIVTATITNKIFHFSLLIAWGSALMIFVGYITHLLLDELYSVSLSGVRIKKSFGTAFKFFSRENVLGFICLYLILASSWFWSPPVIATGKQIYQHVQQDHLKWL